MRAGNMRRLLRIVESRIQPETFSGPFRSSWCVGAGCGLRVAWLWAGAKAAQIGREPRKTRLAQMLGTCFLSRIPRRLTLGRYGRRYLFLSRVALGLGCRCYCDGLPRPAGRYAHFEG